MQVTSAQFVISNTDYRKCPKPDLPEYAFIGRSNVGKSSLINTLTNHGSLAKISSRPGKTQLINHFLINQNWYLVDLPGYGWASTGKEKRQQFAEIIESYITNRTNLKCLFVLVDIRHKLQAIDSEFMLWLGEHQIPFALIFTKADKLPVTKIEHQINSYRADILELWEQMPRYFVTSSLKKKGTEEVLEFIDQLNQASTLL